MKPSCCYFSDSSIACLYEGHIPYFQLDMYHVDVCLRDTFRVQFFFQKETGDD